MSCHKTDLFEKWGGGSHTEVTSCSKGVRLCSKVTEPAAGPKYFEINLCCSSSWEKGKKLDWHKACPTLTALRDPAWATTPPHVNPLYVFRISTLSLWPPLQKPLKWGRWKGRWLKQAQGLKEAREPQMGKATQLLRPSYSPHKSMQHYLLHWFLWIRGGRVWNKANRWRGWYTCIECEWSVTSHLQLQLKTLMRTLTLTLRNERELELL